MEKPIPVFLKVFQKTKEETLPNSFYKASITQITKSDNDTKGNEDYRTRSVMNTDEKILNKISANQI